MGNSIGFIVSIAYIAGVILTATIVAKVQENRSELSRKIIHIMVGNWIFIIPLFSDAWAVMLVPFLFIIINWLSVNHNIIPVMEREEKSYGTVYYAVSIFVLVGMAFLLDWWTVPVIGILTMAYGDGFASIVGEKWGSRRPFKFAPEKSLAGSAAVFLFAFFITFLGLDFLQGTGALQTTSASHILLIAFINGFFSSFVELTGTEGCDNLSLPISAGLLPTLLLQFGAPMLYAYLVLILGVLGYAYYKQALTEDGFVAAFLIGLTLYCFGGIWVSAALIAFFVLGTIVSKLSSAGKHEAEARQSSPDRRDWRQVLCNSLPAALVLWLGYIMPNWNYDLLLAITVFAAATADTFSSEIGMLSNGKVFNILTGRPMRRGLSGGISKAGLWAGLAGSGLIALLAWPIYGFFGFLFAVIVGYCGTLIDSVLGVLYQEKYLNELGELQEFASELAEKPVQGLRFISNNAVNLLSLSSVLLLGSLVLMILP